MTTNCPLTEAQLFVAQMLTEGEQNEKALFHRFETMPSSASIKARIACFIDFQMVIDYLINAGVAERVLRNKGKGSRWLRLKVGASIPSESKENPQATWCSMLGEA